LKRAQEFFAKETARSRGRGSGDCAPADDLAGDGVPRADVVIEAIFENAEAKRELYARLEPRMKAEQSSRPTPRASCRAVEHGLD